MIEDAVVWYRNFDIFLCYIRNYTTKVSEVSHSSTRIAPFCCCFNLYERQN